MKKLFLKTSLYAFLILISLELLVRVFHLYTEVPVRYIDSKGVEKSLPNQTGFAVTGNRRQNFSEYHINNSGFNSYREFSPTKDHVEIAIIGDSFIEGMHQNYYNSIGKKLENKLNNVEVYEYGYAGYNLANQLYLISAYKEKFDLIDHVVIYLKYENDLQNGIYKPNYDRIALLKSPLFKIRDEFKLLSYASNNGILDPIKNVVIKIMNSNKKAKDEESTENNHQNEDLVALENFKNLVKAYGFDKQKISFLLNSKTTSPTFLNYCKSNGYKIIDFAEAFEKAKKPTTLIYDMHWNNYGRELIATVIADYFKKNYSIK
ncbi:hypothetical protein KO566_09550 [Flavobacteriaceae bacterium XHP0103]|uniref:hypothetical protein n=1 Tax=Marixanthotalea marina TaxID=2844359 RepID=UPI002989E499|nr:hypothetical protein [Marixanthotalea marina]MBU3822305.1 hypothetical protein [Marixanthotalea marina]